MESYNKNEKPISSSSSVTIRIIKVNKSLKMAGLVTIFYCWVRLGNQGLSRDQNFPVNTREIHPFSHQSHKFIAYFDLNFVALLFCAMTAKSKILVLGGTGYIGKAYSTKKWKSEGQLKLKESHTLTSVQMPLLDTSYLTCYTKMSQLLPVIRLSFLEINTNK